MGNWKKTLLSGRTWIISVCVSIQNFWDTRIYMPLLKPIQKMPNSHLKMLKQQHFLHQRKNLYNPVSKRSSSDETNTEDNHVRPWQKSFFISQHRTLYLVVWQWGRNFYLTRTRNVLCFNLYSQRISASLGVAPTVNKKLRLTAEHKAVTPHADNTTQQPSIKTPERLTYTQITTTHSRVSSLLNGYSTRR